MGAAPAEVFHRFPKRGQPMAEDKGIPMKWIDEAPRYLFFSGKGGVGKTSLACATAVWLADKGRSVLLVSTDPASNLSHVFEAEVGEDPTPIPGVENLRARNIEPEKAAETYREKVIGPVRGTLPEAAVKSMEEQLSGACTTEIAAFDLFTRILTSGTDTSSYDHLVFDTAPTGHTLRLLKLPGAWTSFLDSNESGASCLGPLSGLDQQREQYSNAVDTLSDGVRTKLVLVARPERMALEETERSRQELEALGLRNQHLIINGVFEPADPSDPLAAAWAERSQTALDEMSPELRGLPSDYVPLQPGNILGADALRALLEGPTVAPLPSNGAFAPPEDLPSLGRFVDELEAAGKSLVMVMGKGGVGKTTIAAAIAAELAQRGHDTHLTTTDPAAHVTQTISDDMENLEISRIDPAVETERYRQHVLETKGKDLDAQGRALLEEDLRSPCTEEVAVFQAFSRVIREGGRRFVVVDTAPTGHTLLLLDSTGAYHREMMRHRKEGMKVTTPMMRLQDRERTRMILVTLPETTPVLEAAQLQEDLRRASIEPWGWVVNASLAAAGPSDPLLARRAEAEVEQIAKVRDQLASRTAVVPWQAEEPTGAANLRKLLGHFAEPAGIPQSAD